MATPTTVAATYNRIDIDMITPLRRREAQALAANIQPGMLCQVDAAGKVIPHATANGAATHEIANYDTFNAGIGNSSAVSINGTFAANAMVTLMTAKRGDLVAVLLADGQNVTKGTLLKSDGAGSLVAVTAVTDNALFEADDDLDLTANGAPALLVCRSL